LPAGGRDLVVDGDAEALVEDLDTEDLGRTHGPELVGAGERDVEGQHLVGVPGRGDLHVLAGRGDGLGIQLVDGGADGRSGGTHDGRLEDRTAVVDLGVLGTDLIDVGDEGAGAALKEVQQGVTLIQIRLPAMPRLLREQARASGLPNVDTGAFSRNVGLRF